MLPLVANSFKLAKLLLNVSPETGLEIKYQFVVPKLLIYVTSPELEPFTINDAPELITVVPKFMKFSYMFRFLLISKDEFELISRFFIALL